MLNSLYSLPNIFVPLLGGMFIDKFGLRIVIIITTSLIAGSSVIVWYGVMQLNYYYILVGRTLFGLGGES